MRNAAKLLRERTDDVAQLMTQEQGKPLNEARGEVRAAADIIDWFAEEGLRVYGRLVPSRIDPSIRQMVVKDPVGSVAAFTPWNFPFNQIVRNVGAAQAAGCSIVVKGPEETPTSPAASMQAFHDAVNTLKSGYPKKTPFPSLSLLPLFLYPDTDWSYGYWHVPAYPAPEPRAWFSPTSRQRYDATNAE